MAIPLDILSDPICPWCYIGKARLERALAQRPNHPFEITWRPFQLNPEMPLEGMDRTAYLERKFGGPEGAKRVYTSIEDTAQADGLDVRFDLIQRTPNTLNAHRLIRWASPGEVQNAIVNNLFRAYFHNGIDISDPDALGDIAAKSGMERAVVVELLSGEADLEAVRREDQTAREAGVGGVPTFLVNGRHVVPGAQDTALWVRVIDELTSGLADAENSGVS